MKHKNVKIFEVKKKKDAKTCQRCGDGTYLARHNQAGKVRTYCGKCHMTIFENKK